MNLRRTLPALLLALALTGCGDDEEPKGSDPAPETDQRTIQGQAVALLACATEQGLPGTINETSEGIPAVDLTTETETIVVHLLESEDEAAGYQNAADLDQEQVENAVILGGAISPEHRAAIVECLNAT